MIAFSSAAAGMVGGALGAFSLVRWRKHMPRIDAALDGHGITDHEHVYDRMINDGRGWKCACGAPYSKAVKRG